MSASRLQAARIRALSDFATLVRRFTDEGLLTLIAAASVGRLVRGVWDASSGGVSAGCPLSCAAGVPGGTRAGFFALLAPSRNNFVLAWDAGLITAADVAALARLEIGRRENRHAAYRSIIDRVRPYWNVFSGLRRAEA